VKRVWLLRLFDVLLLALFCLLNWAVTVKASYLTYENYVLWRFCTLLRYTCLGAVCVAAAELFYTREYRLSRRTHHIICATSVGLLLLLMALAYAAYSGMLVFHWGWMLDGNYGNLIWTLLGVLIRANCRPNVSKQAKPTERQ